MWSYTYHQSTYGSEVSNLSENAYRGRIYFVPCGSSHCLSAIFFAIVRYFLSFVMMNNSKRNTTKYSIITWFGTGNKKQNPNQKEAGSAALILKQAFLSFVSFCKGQPTVPCYKLQDKWSSLVHRQRSNCKMFRNSFSHFIRRTSFWAMS